VPGPPSAEDAASVTVRAIPFPPSQGSGVAFTVSSAGPGVPPVQEEWAKMFGQLKSSVASAMASLRRPRYGRQQLFQR
jgi:hypothetical protein